MPEPPTTDWVGQQLLCPLSTKRVYMTTRRKLLATIASGSVAASAGCASLPGGNTRNADDDATNPERPPEDPPDPEAVMGEESMEDLEERQEQQAEESGYNDRKEVEGPQEAESFSVDTVLRCTDENAGRIEHDNGVFTIRGRIRAPDSCYTAVTGGQYRADSKTLSIAIKAEDDEDGSNCEDCLSAVRYKGTYTMDVEVATVNLYHITGEETVHIDSLAP